MIIHHAKIYDQNIAKTIIITSSSHAEKFEKFQQKERELLLFIEDQKKEINKFQQKDKDESLLVEILNKEIEKLQEKYAFTEFSLENLYINGLISRTASVKILATGEIKSALNFKVNAISDKAKAAIEASGGTVEILK